MKAIGGYPALELHPRGQYHHSALRVNSARNALELCLRANGIRKVYLPLFTCSAMLEPITRLGIECERYPIDYDLEPVSIPDLGKGEAFVYTNYFDLKRDAARRLAKAMPSGLIIDNAQAFYAPRPGHVDALYSPRKFFGVSDGGLLVTSAQVELPEETDKSAERILPQLRRLDTGAESGYADFRRSEESIDNCPPRRMSRLTEAILGSADYEWAAARRRENFDTLARELGHLNGLSRVIAAADGDFVPLVYPFLENDSSLRRHLIEEKIFVATYWPNVLEEAPEGSVEHNLASHMLPLPVDQSLDGEDMKRIADTIKRYL